VTGTCVIQDPTPPALPASVGYVRVRIFLEGDTLAQATAIQDAIRAADRDDLEGWIVDLRNSRGGNMWPALAGIGPVLGTGTAGHFVGIGSVTPWGYEDGRAWLGSATMVALAGPYELRRPMPRVAVLTDIGVSSSGEAIAIAFRGRPNTRSFGAATCGLSTAVAQFPLTNGARVGVVTSLMADRRQATYGNEVIPDEVIGGADEVVARAVAWLVTGADPLQLSSVRQDD
jgi:C-terminal processing protease CtpA/Prc